MLNFFFRRRFFLYFWREGKGGTKSGRETFISCLLHALNGGPGLQPRHVPWLGSELVTSWFAGQCWIHWATPARAGMLNFLALPLGGQWGETLNQCTPGKFQEPKKGSCRVKQLVSIHSWVGLGLFTIWLLSLPSITLCLSDMSQSPPSL